MTSLQSQRIDLRSRRWLVLATLSSAVLMVVAGSFVAGTTGFIVASLCVLACGAPAAFCFSVSEMLRPMYMLAASSILRMAFALALAVGVKLFKPMWGLREFYAWLLVAYMVFLVIDTFELLRANQQEVSHG